jgi:hypothetical protein
VAHKKEPENNFFKISHRLLETTAFRDLSNREFKLFIYLCKLRNRFGKKDGSFYSGERAISDMCGMNRLTMRKARDGLVKAGVLDYIHQTSPGRRASYRLLV